jgi:predicted trehalose synthase
MTFQVRDMLRKYGAANRGADPEEFRARFERTEELTRRAMEAVREGSDPRALQWVERAEEKLRQSEELMREGHATAAVRQLDQAHRLAQRALRQAGRNPDVEEFETAARRYEEQLRRTTQTMDGPPKSAAGELLRESEQHYQLARELARAGEESMQRAMAELHLAFRLLNRAADLSR